MKIKYLEKRNKWQVDFHTKIPQVKDPRPHKNKKVGRTTSDFNSKEEAVAWSKEVLELDRKRDTSLSGVERMDFIQAKRALTDAGFDEVSLEDVAKDWLKYKTKITSTASVGECYDQWLNDMDKKADVKTRSKQSVENCKRARKHLLPYFDIEIGEFLKPELAEKFSNEFERREWKSLVTRKNDWGKCVQFFNWCKSKKVKHLPHDQPNPLDDLIDLDVGVTGAPYVMNPNEAESIMHSAQRTNSDYGLLPFFILHFFCGIRPSEAQGISWSDVRLEDPNDPFIRVPQRATGKNKKPRTISLKQFPNIVEWLKVCDRSKQLFPYSVGYNGKVVRSFNKNRILVFKDAGVELDSKYNDCGRHACATYLMKGMKGWTPADITDRLGHTGKILMKHYSNPNVLMSDAQAYWNIKPIAESENLVKFSA